MLQDLHRTPARYRPEVRIQSALTPSVFGGIYRSLYRLFSKPEFDWLRSAFEDYIAFSWAGSIGRRNLRMPDSMLARLTWMPLSTASSRTGLSKNRLTQLIDSSRLEATRRTTMSGREFVMVRQVDIDALVSINANVVCLAEASRRLGMKRQRLSGLLPSLCPDVEKSTLRGTPWLIPLVLQDVQGGRFSPLGRCIGLVGLSGLLFNRDQVLEKYGHQRSALITIPEAANRMGVKQQVAYAFARLGFLEVQKFTVGRRQAQGVSAVAIETFLNRFVLGSDLSKYLRRSPRAVVEALAAEGLKPVAGPALGNCRQTVYLRQGMEAIPWLSAFTRSVP